jgi:ectoine hydroxylase-related dioxygenase (phytanoyl-CoA dioxygenase family)
MRAQALTRPTAFPGLTPAQIEEFFEEGFVVLRGVFRPEEVAEMRAAFERLSAMAERLGVSRSYRGAEFVLGPLPEGRPGVRIDRIVWCGAADRVLSAYGMDPRLLATAASLLGSRRMSQLINQAHFKLPGDGVEFPWHQDSVHRRYGRGEWSDLNGRGSYVQTTIPLDDVTAENGPLELLPRSCRLGHVEPPADAEPGWLPPELDPADAVAPTMRAGDLLLFGPYTFHRSGPNRSDRPRRTLINGYAYPGANSRKYPGRGAGRLLSL